MTENLIINGVDHAKFDLEWAKRGGVLMMTTGNVLALMKVVEGNYFLIADFFKDDDIGWRKNSPPSHYLHGGEDLRMAIPAECEAAGIEYIKRPVSDEELAELRKDRDRLDWIFNNSKPIIAEKNDFDCNMCTAELWFSSDGCSGTMLENRDELDNAMKEVIK